MKEYTPMYKRIKAASKELREMSLEEFRKRCVEVGTHTKTGKLTKKYKQK